MSEWSKMLELFHDSSNTSAVGELDLLLHLRPSIARMLAESPPKVRDAIIDKTITEG